MTHEQRSLLNKNTHSLKPLSAAGHLNVWQVFVQPFVPICIFLFALGILTITPRYSNPDTIVVLCGIGLFAGLLYPTIAFLLVVIGVVSTKLRTRIRWAPVIFWSWWPCWKFSACVIAAAAGIGIGDYIWYNQLLPYHQMDRLQAYDNVNPSTVEGVRMQDAGVVEFRNDAGVDRSRTGCIQNGATYCIAPVVMNGKVEEGSEPGVTYDFFMAGKDCCNCPGEFRCDDWNMPSSTLGGMRIVDQGDRAFYRLASEQWASLYGKPVEHPIFFTWSDDPVQDWHDLRSTGSREVGLACLCVPFALITYAFLANGVLGILFDRGYAAPSEAPMPPQGMGRGMAARFLPQMHKYTSESHAQQTGTVVL